MKDTTVLNKSKQTIQILLKYKIPVFFIETHSIYNKNIKIEDSKISKVSLLIISMIIKENYLFIVKKKKKSIIL